MVPIPEGYSTGNSALQFTTSSASTGIAGWSRVMPEDPLRDVSSGSTSVARRIGVIEVTWDLLKELLKLPEDCTLIGIGNDYNRLQVLRLTVMSPNLQEVRPNEYVPTVTIEQLTGYDA